MEQIMVSPGTLIELGRAGESGVRQIVFDLSAFAAFGPGHAELVAELPGDELRYPIPVKEEAGTAVWTVTSAVTGRSGYGRVQLSYLSEDRVVKSEIYDTWVASAVGDPTETQPPEPQRGWVDEVLRAGAAAAESAAAVQGTAEEAKNQADRAAREADRSGSAARALIDDAAVSQEQVWSSDRSRRYVVETLCPPFEADSAVVVCEPVQDCPLEVISRIAVEQAGAGVPSPDNVRPFLARTGVKLTRCGRNLIRPEQISVAKYNLNVQDAPVLLRAGITYTFSTRTTASGLYVKQFPPAAGENALAKVYSSSRLHYRPEEDAEVALEAYFVKGLPQNEAIMLEADTSAGEYEPYSGSDFSAVFGRKVYGGEYNWSDGTLSAVHHVKLNGIDGYGRHQNGTGYAVVMVGTGMAAAGGMSDRYEWGPWNDRSGTCYITGSTLIIVDRRFTSEQAAAALIRQEQPEFLLFGKSEQVQLTARQIPAQPGRNTLYSDTGATVVRGRKDPVAVFREQQEKIRRLEASVLTVRGDMRV